MGEEKETLWGRERMVRSEVREEANELLESTYPEDRLHEIVDGCIPVYTSDLMEMAADNIDLAVNEPEVGPAFDGSPTPVNIVAGNVYDALMVVAYDEWEAIKDDRATSPGFRTDDH